MKDYNNIYDLDFDDDVVLYCFLKKSRFIEEKNSKIIGVGRNGGNKD